MRKKKLEHIGSTEAARIMGVDPSHVRWLIKQGRMQSVVVGKTHLIDPAEARAFRRERNPAK